MGAKWGTVPTDTELTTVLQALSQQLYHGDWGVGRGTWGEYRPRHIATAKRILSARRLPNTGPAWATLVEQLTGKAIRPLEESRRQAATHRWNRISNAEADPPTLLAPVARLGPSAWQLTAEEGIPAIARWRPIRQWCPATQRYIETGKELVYELR